MEVLSSIVVDGIQLFRRHCKQLSQPKILCLIQLLMTYIKPFPKNFDLFLAMLYYLIIL